MGGPCVVVREAREMSTEELDGPEVHRFRLTRAIGCEAT